MFAKTKIAVLAAVGLAHFTGAAQAETVLNVATAGSQNMVDYVKTYLAPKFEAMHPDVKVNVVGTGPGDAGSHKIMEKLSAQQQSGAETVGSRCRRCTPENWW